MKAAGNGALPRPWIKAGRGFTLIELMITVAIVAILSSIALPAYTDYVRRGRIPEATANLQSSQARMEQWFQDAKSYYRSGSTSSCGVNLPGDLKFFTLSCEPTSATAYVLRATGKGSMAGFAYTINQDGKRTSAITSVSGWSASSDNCWITSKGGACQ